MIDVFIGLAIFGLGLIVGAIISSVIKARIIVTEQKEESKPIFEPIEKKFYKLELTENDDPDEEDRESKRDRLEDRNFYS